jgi:hypothetical protein
MKSRRSILFTAATLFSALAIPPQPAAQSKGDQMNARHHHYHLIDMGTFGGPVSSIGQGPPSSQLNRHGLTVGWSATSTSTSSTSNPLIFPQSSSERIRHAWDLRPFAPRDNAQLPCTGAPFARYCH